MNSGKAAARLREERHRLGLNQPDFGKLGGVSKNTQLAYENATSPIPLDYLLELEKHGVDVSYVASGVRTADLLRRPASASGRRRAAAGELVEVPEIDPAFGLGGVVMDEQPAPEMRTFSRAWLRQITTTPPDDLYWAAGRGNSMAPTIDDGEPVLIDRRQQSLLEADLIWAFAWGDIGAIKRLRPMPDGTVKILSDNPAVPPDLAHGSEIHIFGRVVAVVKNL